MINKDFLLVVVDADNKISKMAVTPNNTLKIKFSNGHKYILKNINNNFAPTDILLKNVNGSLQLVQAGEANPLIVIDEYPVANAGQSPFMGMADDGQLYNYVVAEEPVNNEIKHDSTMADGDTVSAHLGGNPQGAATDIFKLIKSDLGFFGGKINGWLAALASAGVAGIAGIVFKGVSPSKGDVIDPGVGVKPGKPTVFDNQDPVTGEIKENMTSNDKYPVISGAGSPGSIIVIYDNNVAIGSELVRNDGRWSFKPSSTQPFSEGKHTLTLTTKSSSGEQSAASDAFVFYVDTVAPPVINNVALNDDAGDFKGALKNGDITDDATPVISGTAEAGSRIDIYDNGVVIGSTVADSNGVWQFTPPSALTNGEHILTVTATDLVGNSSGASAQFKITVDTTPNWVKIIAVKDDQGDLKGDLSSGSFTDDNKPELVGMGKPGSKILIKDGNNILGSTVVNPDGKWTYTPDVSLTDGDHRLLVESIDLAGNKAISSGADVEFNIKIDTQRPVTPTIDALRDDKGEIQGPLANGAITDDATPILSGTAASGSKIAIYDNGNQIGTALTDSNGHWRFTPSTDLTEGRHSFTAIATNRAGNISTSSNKFELTTDYTGPNLGALAITEVIDDQGAKTGQVGKGEVTDDTMPMIKGRGDKEGDTIYLYTTDTAGKHLLGTAKVDSSGNWFVNIPSALREGLNKLSIESRDAVGNKTELVETYDINVFIPTGEAPIFEVDDDEPAGIGKLQSEQKTNDNTPTLVGVAGANDLITIYSDNVAIGSTTADGEGNWTFTIGQPGAPIGKLDDGRRVLTVTAKDAAGNVQTSDNFVIELYTTIPDRAPEPVIFDNFDDTGAVNPGAKTDDNTPTLSGKVAPGNTVTIYMDKKPLGDEIRLGDAIDPIRLGDALVKQNGDWSYEVARQSDGEYTFTIIVTDPFGNQSPRSTPVKITIDTSGYMLSLTEVKDNVGSKQENIGNHVVTDDNTPTLIGRGKVGSEVIIKENGVLIGTTEVKSDGNGGGIWTFSFSENNKTLSDGSHTLTVESGNPAYNPITPISVTFTVDATKPLPPSIKLVHDDVGNILDDIKPGGTTDDTKPTLSGTAEAWAQVLIYDDNKYIGTTTSQKDGTWTFTPISPLDKGSHEFTVIARDLAGNDSEKSAPYTINVDTVSNWVTITSVSDNKNPPKNLLLGDSTNSQKLTLSGKGKANSIVEIKVGNEVEGYGSTKVDGNGNWSIPLTKSLSPGPHLLVAESKDKVSNPVRSEGFDINVDTTAPDVPDINYIFDFAGDEVGDVSNGGSLDDDEPILGGMAEPGSTIRIYDKGVFVGKVITDDDGVWEFTPSEKFQPGKHVYTATATDKAGNTSGESNTFTVYIDTTPNTVSISKVEVQKEGSKETLQPGASTNINKLILTGTGKADSTVIIKSGNKWLGEETVDQNGNWTISSNIELDEGLNNIIAVSTDKVKNTVTSSGFEINIDKTAPKKPVIKVLDDVGDRQGEISAGTETDDTEPTITGKTEANGTVTIFNNGARIGKVTADGNGNWWFTPKLGVGSHNITVTVADGAKNTSVASDPIKFEINTTSNSITIGEVVDHQSPAKQIEQGGMTNDKRPVLSGEGKIGSTVIIKYNGVRWDDKGTLVDTKGKWTFNPPTDLKDGKYTLVAESTDLAGNKAEASFTIEVDSTKPATPEIPTLTDDVGRQTGALSNGDTTDDARPTFSGTTEAGGLVTIYDKYEAKDKESIGSVKAGPDGKWQFTPTKALGNGNHKFTVTVTDLAGNVSDPSPEIAINVDMVAETLTIDKLIDNKDQITGDISFGGKTNDNQPEVQGRGTVGRTVKIKDGDTYLEGSVTIKNDGTWSLEIGSKLSNGLHTLIAETTDSISGNTITSNSFNITVDTVSPTKPSIDSALDDMGARLDPLNSGDSTDDTTPTFSGEAKGASWVAIYQDDQLLPVKTERVNNDKWSWTPNTPLGEGLHKFKVKAIDDAGNVSEDYSNEFTITVDLQPNVVSIDTVTDSKSPIVDDLSPGSITDDPQPVLKGKGKAGAEITIKNGDTPLRTEKIIVNDQGVWTFKPATPLVDNKYMLIAESKDQVGNIVSSGVFDITIDTTKPDVPIIKEAIDDVGDKQSPPLPSLKNGDVTDDLTPTIKGTAEKNSKVSIYIYGVLKGTVTADKEGIWSFPTTKLEKGTYKFTAVATDAAGNKSDPSTEFILNIDNTVPAAPRIVSVNNDDNSPTLKAIENGSYTNDRTPIIEGTADAGMTINIYRADIDAGKGSDRRIFMRAVTADRDTGKWTYSPEEALKDGVHNIIAFAVSPAGVESYVSNTWTINVDATIPDATIAITSITEDTGSSGKDFITDDNTLLINGSLNKALLSNEWVEVSLNNGAWQRASVEGTTWSYDHRNTPLTDGRYTITARIVDKAGNLGASTKQALVINTQGRDMAGLKTTLVIATDTYHGLESGDAFSHGATATNSDQVTRDASVTIAGSLSAALRTGEVFQLSLDGGVTWVNTVLEADNKSWSHILPQVNASTTYNMMVRALDVSGKAGINTQFAPGYRVVIDLDSPEGISVKPVVSQQVDHTEILTFNSSQHGRAEGGAIVALVDDVNFNGTYQEGIDKIIGFADVDANGTWSLSTKLSAGAHNLAFVVWDAAGNHSAMGASTHIGVTAGHGYEVKTLTWGGTTNGDSNHGLNSAAVTMGANGLWSFFQSARLISSPIGTAAYVGRVYDVTSPESYNPSTYLSQHPNLLSSRITPRYVNSATFADINRDGAADVMTQINDEFPRTAYWLKNGNSFTAAPPLGIGSESRLGGVIAYDRQGDGYLDFVQAGYATSSTPTGISFIRNQLGTLSAEQGIGFKLGHPGGNIPSNLSIIREVSAVDIDNNGTVDITAHININSVNSSSSSNSRSLGILYNQITKQTETTFGQVGYYDNVFRGDGAEKRGDTAVAMTYADFNGDGWLDLFLSRGSKGGVDSDESRIYLNDGKGGLKTADNQVLWFGDSLAGRTSLAVDWNLDGKMDLIEVPVSRSTSGPTIYLNPGEGNSWRGAPKATLDLSSQPTTITGAVAIDYDWDGSRDLILYHPGDAKSVSLRDNAAPSSLVKNTNTAADGTSLHIRIVDGEGINVFYGNTVKLYNSTGKLIATQVINPQSTGSTNSTGLVSFFGLDPEQVYSVQLLRITNGQINHVGATAFIGGAINGTVNLNWGNLRAGKAHDAYVLTAERDDAVNNTIGGGIIGTGYNDTFFSSAGDDTYQGSGGWNMVGAGNSTWSAIVGMDVVDYRTAPGGIDADLQQNFARGHGTDIFENIEGLRGGAYADTFTDNAANNLFEGRGGNDVFNLVNGGNDILMYKLLSGMGNDSRGGNGQDTVNGFTVGKVASNSDADRIDLSDLLSYSGPISFFMDNGKLTLDHSSSAIEKYLDVNVVGANTVISIDRDGGGSTYAMTELITLTNVKTDLITLLQNNQIII